MNFAPVEEQAALTASRAIRHLVHYSKFPAIALMHEVRPTNEFPTHAEAAIFERKAAEAGLFLVPLVRTVPKGFEYVLFLAKSEGLSEEALLACRPVGTRNRHDPEDLRGRSAA